MATARQAKVGVELVEIRRGLWCAACALPSLAELTVAAKLGDRLTLTTRRKCQQCGVEPCR